MSPHTRGPGSGQCSGTLTTADLVVMSLLYERPMHGYELNVELERRDVRDWAAISRAQVYYSLSKLLHMGYLEEDPKDQPSPDRRRRTCRLASKGRRAYQEAVKSKEWAGSRPLPSFVTWVALAVHLDRKSFSEQVERRRSFLLSQLAKEKSTLAMIRTGNPKTEAMARASVRFIMSLFQAELAWLEEISAPKA